MKIKRLPFQSVYLLSVACILTLNPGCKNKEAGDEPVHLSGIYPHLAMYNQKGECGTGAVVPWAGKLWTLTYAPHSPFGNESNKLYSITPTLERTIHTGSIGGTPASRMIHEESNQFFMGPYAIGMASACPRQATATTVPTDGTQNGQEFARLVNRIF